MKKIEITDITNDSILKIQNDTIEELQFKPSYDDVIKGLILMVLNEGLGKELKKSMELIKYDKKIK